jgi:hypothetical protein
MGDCRAANVTVVGVAERPGLFLLRRDSAWPTKTGLVVRRLRVGDGDEERRADRDRCDEIRPSLHVISLRLDRPLRSRGGDDRMAGLGRT